MKQQIHPAVMVVVVVILVVGAAAFLFRAATEKPTYPGLNAGKPAAEMAKGGQQDNRHVIVPTGGVSYDQAKKYRIPGMNPAGAPPPSKTPGQ
jgi:hypothetical protein